MLKERAPHASQAHIPEEYEVLDARALADRLGFKRDTILSYLSKASFHRIPQPDRHLATGPIWYELSVRDWEQNNRQRRMSSRKKYNSL